MTQPYNCPHWNVGAAGKPGNPTKLFVTHQSGLAYLSQGRWERAADDLKIAKLTTDPAERQLIQAQLQVGPISTLTFT